MKSAGRTQLLQTRFIAWVTALLCCASSAEAVPVVALEWRTPSASSTTISVSGTIEEEIVADIVLRLDAGDDSRGLFISFLWDEDGQDELDLIGFRESLSVSGIGWGPIIQGVVATGAVPSVESSAGVSGVQGGFESVPPLGSPAPASGPLAATLGSVSFRTNPANVTNDGNDVRVDALANGLDAFIFGNFVACDAATPCLVGFQGAAVNLAEPDPVGMVPEPGTALLIAVAGLVAGLRSARSRPPSRNTLEPTD